ncbi:MAG: hydantoinase B/oxoprolinase family protein [Candidatus Desulfofervidaceae bacterium]|nr:hydantoinase B/oxoprolinase family protein [Candidatus Desulfofervidaceae bacterium]
MSVSKAVELEIFNKILSSIAEEMGIVLRRSAFSPNIRERRDFSCAIFDTQGEMVAQASHIPVHLGAMPLTIQELLPQFDWQAGDVVITNDPFQGGTHLPDITLIKPVFIENKLSFFLINRAHHADIGGKHPGSMAVTTHIDEEGILIYPRKLLSQGKSDKTFFEDLLGQLRNPLERKGDFEAQLASLNRGERRIQEIARRYGLKKLNVMAQALKDYSEKAMRHILAGLPQGVFTFTDYLDDDGIEAKDIPLAVRIEIKNTTVTVDLRQSSPQVKGSVNAPRAVTQAAVYYVFLCLLKTNGEYPINHGCFRPLEILTTSGTVVDARYPAAVAAGNVETSQRVVDTILGALAQVMPKAIPAASCGSMNNIAIGGIHPQTNKAFTYYETIGGGMGARPTKDGLSGIHTHMTNTLNTPIEALEHDYPFMVESYRLRKGSGGVGLFKGGDGLVRSYYFLSPVSVTILSERRRHAPYGLCGGKPGRRGENILIRNGQECLLPGKVNLAVEPGDKLIIHTPGGGGWG